VLELIIPDGILYDFTNNQGERIEIKAIANTDTSPATVYDKSY
jgi:hypothetical protein